MGMADLITRLRTTELDDHARGCEGRQYTCTCGFDDRLYAILEEAAAALTTAQAEAEALKQRIAELERVVAQASVWFEEYAEQHAAKAKQAVDSYEQASRRQKAARNAERAAVVRAALSENGNG
jgi:hypothetical protein